jgi:8-oxo-dGTP pyrophosphatase MutT (NUDIX family)
MFEIPAERLPPGFTDTLENPPDPPVTPLPAATTVLLRDGRQGPEALLMQRHRRSGFVPGAWVFPGGRVDEGDHDPVLAERTRGLPPEPEPPAAFWMAAIRELFEETGVVLGRSADEWADDATGSPEIATLRDRLLDEACTLPEVVRQLDVVLDASRMTHVAHWVTPVVEPRRYDTHFFAVALPPGRRATADAREMTEAVWLDPGSALDRFERGELPMVFPTVKTLAMLRDYPSVDAILTAGRERPVRRILPRLVRTDIGVAIVVDEP